MRSFLAGLLVGAAAASAVAWVWGPAPDTTRAAPPVRPDGTEASPGARPAPRTTDDAALPAVAFPPGRVRLGIGDGHVFGERRARRGAAPGSADIRCQDIRYGASLECPHGAVPADVPLAAVGLPGKAAEAALLVTDAPRDLPQRNAWLTAQPKQEKTGIALVRAASGAVYRVHLLEESGDPDALRRTVLLAYEEVPVVDGGGVLRLPSLEAPAEGAGPTQATIQAIYERGRAIPGDSFADHIVGSYMTPGTWPETLTLTDRRHLLAEQPLRTTVVLEGRGAVYAAKGILPEGAVRLESYAAVAVEGAMEGRIDVKSYGYVHVAGDVTGTLDLGSYATVVVEGDLLGTMKVRSYVDLLLKGRILGTLDVKGSCWSTFYFATYRSRADLEAMPGDFRQITLHLRESDLPAGGHKEIGTWREVIVADPVWAKLQ